MPVNSSIAWQTWNRYAWCRDNGHSEFINKATKCERFFRGEQWDPADLAKLKLAKRPAMTINKIMSTISNVMGEQISNRAETIFRPRAGAPETGATIMTKVFKQISDSNQLDWLRSDMFADGIIQSRGYLDVRLSMDDSARGTVEITKPNPKNVMIDPDADEYDPDTWSEVFLTKWMTADDIAVLYSKEDADILRGKGHDGFSYGYDSVQAERDRFGTSRFPSDSGEFDHTNVLRNIRVIDRQFRMLDRQQHFLNPKTGDMRPVPEDFDRNRIAFFVEQFGFTVVKKPVRRIRWRVVADDVVLHDDWSPYQHFTIIPYFPHFRHGHTLGLVENLLNPQEILNKIRSQELHIVNTTANSGYKVKTGALANMTVAELEERGAETGIVIEVNGDPDADVQKIAPNQVPTGLDRISYKAEEDIKGISGISDSMQGMDRADVAAKAIQAKKQAGATNLIKPLDNLTRSDWFLARAVLDLVQEFYTEERVMTITHDGLDTEAETFTINQMSPTGEVLNDLTEGEYDIMISSVPKRETLEDSQFEQAVALKELGVMLPDSVLIENSRLINRREILSKMQAAQETPEAKAQRELQARAAQAEVAKTEAETGNRQADSGLKVAKTQEILQGEPDDGSGQAKMAEADTKLAVADHKATIDETVAEHKMSIAERQLQLQREKQEGDQALQAQDMAQKRIDARAQQVREAATTAARPPARPTANRSRRPISK